MVYFQTSVSCGTSACGIRHNSIYYTKFHIILLWFELVFILYPHFQGRILLLSYDAETNPGPISEDKNEVLESITSCKTELLQEIRFVKSDINRINEEISTIEQDKVSFKQDIITIKSKQKFVENDITSLQTRVTDLEQQNELLQNYIDWLYDKLSKNGEYMGYLEKDIDRLKAHKRRVFRIPEDENDTAESIKGAYLHVLR